MLDNILFRLISFKAGTFSRIAMLCGALQMERMASNHAKGTKRARRDGLWLERTES